MYIDHYISKNEKRYQFLSENLKYELTDSRLTLRFKYNIDVLNQRETTSGDKYKIVSCFKNNLRCYSDRRIDIRLNVCVYKNRISTYEEEIDCFESYYKDEFVDEYHNANLVISDKKYMKIIVPEPFRPESEMWISNTRRSKTLSSLTVPYDRKFKVPFTKSLIILFSLYTPKDCLKDQSCFNREQIDLEP